MMMTLLTIYEHHYSVGTKQCYLILKQLCYNDIPKSAGNWEIFHRGVQTRNPPPSYTTAWWFLCVYVPFCLYFRMIYLISIQYSQSLLCLNLICFLFRSSPVKGQYFLVLGLVNAVFLILLTDPINLTAQSKMPENLRQ